MNACISKKTCVNDSENSIVFTRLIQITIKKIYYLAKRATNSILYANQSLRWLPCPIFHDKGSAVFPQCVCKYNSSPTICS